MNYDDFIDQVADLTDVSIDDAEALTVATLETLSERIGGGEARDLAAQLPKPLQPALHRPGERGETFGLVEFVQRVSDRAAVDDVVALDGVRAVLGTLRDAVSGGEFEDVLSQLPREFWDLAMSTA